MLEFIILGTLYYRQLTGYDIRKCIDAGIGMFYKASYGSIYPLLARLLEQGMVTCSETKESNRNQKVYAITDEGKKYFDEWLRSDENVENKTEAIIAKVFFFDKLDRENVYKQISQFQQRVEIRLKELINKRDYYVSNYNEDEIYYKLSTLYFGIAKLQSIISWCEVAKNKAGFDELIKSKDDRRNTGCKK